jgi:hypothetical protein
MVLKNDACQNFKSGLGSRLYGKSDEAKKTERV